MHGERKMLEVLEWFRWNPAKHVRLLCSSGTLLLCLTSHSLDVHCAVDFGFSCTRRTWNVVTSYAEPRFTLRRLEWRFLIRRVCPGRSERAPSFRST